MVVLSERGAVCHGVALPTNCIILNLVVVIVLTCFNTSGGEGDLGLIISGPLPLRATA